MIARSVIGRGGMPRPDVPRAFLSVFGAQLLISCSLFCLVQASSRTQILATERKANEYVPKIHQTFGQKEKSRAAWKADPWYFRSGYLKERLLDALRQAPLTEEDKISLRELILKIAEAAGSSDDTARL